MDYALRFAQLWQWYWAIPVFIGALALRFWWHRRVVYRYSLASILAQQGFVASSFYERALAALRITVFILLIFLLAKPQLVDKRSHITVEGIDIMLVLDVSGSMQFKDYDDDARSRIEVAKDEAVRFIEKRNNDAIGLVIFGNDALSRAPLTLDKKMLIGLVRDLNLGIINPDGTLLSTAILTASNRLKHSKSRSKVMILLTDGEPSEGDLDSSVAIDIAKKLGIKIYTIGVGSDEERVLHHPLFGPIRAPKINSLLLTRIAQETGGKYFLARSSHDMRTVYDTIDRLEKTKIEAPIFGNYHDLFIPFIWCILMLLCLELLLVSFWWFRM